MDCHIVHRADGPAENEFQRLGCSDSPDDGIRAPGPKCRVRRDQALEAGQRWCAACFPRAQEARRAPAPRGQGRLDPLSAPGPAFLPRWVGYRRHGRGGRPPPVRWVSSRANAQYRS